mmetsp:Transcript_85544/g.277025  ORF Transcript_85544/g.277025 Transcript_85544/m.277025 type:complete len:315 (+) Transcript_85544:64-1008(+)
MRAPLYMQWCAQDHATRLERWCSRLLPARCSEGTAPRPVPACRSATAAWRRRRRLGRRCLGCSRRRRRRPGPARGEVVASPRRRRRRRWLWRWLRRCRRRGETLVDEVSDAQHDEHASHGDQDDPQGFVGLPQRGLATEPVFLTTVVFLQLGPASLPVGVSSGAIIADGHILVVPDRVKAAVRQLVATATTPVLVQATPPLFLRGPSHTPIRNLIMALVRAVIILVERLSARRLLCRTELRMLGIAARAPQEPVAATGSAGNGHASIHQQPSRPKSSELLQPAPPGSTVATGQIAPVRKQGFDILGVVCRGGLP